MFHTQQFSSAGFRSGQTGLDMQNDAARPFGIPVVSQYKGMTPRFEPTGTVPSYYDPQKQGMSMQGAPREQPLKQIQHSSRSMSQPMMQAYQKSQPVQQAWQFRPYGQTAASPTVSMSPGSRGGQSGYGQHWS